MQRIELIARIFAETGIKDVFKCIYQLIQRYEDREKIAYLNGKFIPIDVSRWKESLNCVVNVGIGSGSQTSKLQTMSSIMNILQTLVQNGGMGTLVQPQNIYNAISEYIEQSGYKNVNSFLTDPATIPPKQPQPSMEDQLSMQKAQLEVEKLKMQAQNDAMDASLKQQELEMKKKTAAVDFAIKQQDLELKKQQLVLNEAELRLEAVQGRPVGIGPK